jgi:hypothetical protein
MMSDNFIVRAQLEMGVFIRQSLHSLLTEGLDRCSRLLGEPVVPTFHNGSSEPYSWWALYKDALFETDPQEIQQKTALALKAVEQRKTALTDRAHEEEWTLLQYASLILRRMLRNRQEGVTGVPTRRLEPKVSAKQNNCGISRSNG